MTFNNLKVWSGSYAGSPALLAQTGMGPQAATAAVRVLLGAYPIRCLVSFGFAGGLDAALSVGSLALYRRLSMADQIDLTLDETLSERVYALALSAGLPVLRVSGVTVDHVVCEPGEKRDLAAGHQAQAVDMESYCLAQAAAEWGVSFLAVRAISDAVDERLPPLERWAAPGGWWHAARDLAAKPHDAAALLRLRRNVRRAQGALVAFFRAGQEETALWT